MARLYNFPSTQGNGQRVAVLEFGGGFDQSVLPGAFILVGNNRSTQVDGYSAAQGYDLCTGWGSTNGNELLKQLGTWLSNQQKGPSQQRRGK